MKTKVCLGIVIASLAGAGQAMAQNYCELERIHVQSQGEGVTADFSSVDTSTCALGIETTVHVEGSQGVIDVADLCGRGATHIRRVSSTQTSVVAIVVSVFDRCLGTEVLSVTGTGEPDHLHVSNSLKTASLRATLEGVDVYDEPVSIAIDLVWSIVSQRERTVEHENVNGGIIRHVSTSSGTVRKGTASGTVTLAGIDQTPLESMEATVERDVLHQLIVYR